MQQNGANKYKLIAYNYDLISGKVNQVHFQPGEKDQFYHRYEYDSENRLTDVYTTNVKDFVGVSNLEEKEAFYQYYKHGPLARTILGQQQVQGLDYAYTLQGWLKGVNSTGLNPEYDMGNDGKAGSAQEHVARDVYGFNLNYFNGDFTNDYNSINNREPFPGHSGLLDGNHRNLFNGNITSMAVNIKFPGEAENVIRGVQLYNYKYDQLNRLVAMDVYRGFNSTLNQWKNPIGDPVGDYRERVSYDGNGNILTYERNGSTIGGKPLAMDDLQYGYNKVGGNLVNNKLRHVKDDPELTSNYTEDIDDQGDDNYSYDAIGNLISDDAEKITNIKWNVYGKIEEITKTPTVENPVTKISYTYDAVGNRISKKIDKQGAASETTWYVRDAGGNTMAVYSNKDVLKLNEQHIYGSSRLGIVNKDIPVADPSVTGENNNLLGTTYLNSFERGKKFFELINHLGNELVTISDKKLQVTGSEGGESNGECETGTGEDVLNKDVRNNESSYVARTEVNLIPGFDSEVGDDYTAYTDATLADCIEYTAPPVGTEGWYYNAEIVSANDYAPFGMGLVNRKWNSGEYRYGMNGQERSSELNDNLYTALFWEYDSRLGRRWNLDPRPNVSFSRYAAFANNPIFNSDPLGDTTVPQGDWYRRQDGKNITYKYGAGTDKEQLDANSKTWWKIPEANRNRVVTFGKDFAPTEVQSSIDLHADGTFSVLKSDIREGSVEGHIKWHINLPNGGNVYVEARDYMQSKGVGDGSFWGAAGTLAGDKVVKVGGAVISKLASKGGYSTIYRAVSQAEVDDIAKYGFRMKEGGYETGKLFAPTLQEATQFGKYNFGLDGIPNTIMKVRVPNSVLNGATKFGADGMNAISIPANQLHLLKGTPLNFSPWLR